MSKFKRLTSISEIDSWIENHKLSFIYIYQDNCSVCHGLLPQVKQVLQNYPKIQPGIVNADQVKEIAGKFSVFTVPVLLLFVEGKEYIREARIVQMKLFEEKIKKIYSYVVAE